jgi:hypothetical protein
LVEHQTVEFTPSRSYLMVTGSNPVGRMVFHFSLLIIFQFDYSSEMLRRDGIGNGKLSVEGVVGVLGCEKSGDGGSALRNGS